MNGRTGKGEEQVEVEEAVRGMMHLMNGINWISDRSPACLW